MLDMQKILADLQAALNYWEIPGASLAVVEDGEVRYVGGVGSRDEKGTPVDGKTLFQIASCSKAFTAALAGVLATEGKLDFDTPVIEYMPEFRLNDVYATNVLTVRDFLSHRTGLPRHEYAWYGTSYTRAELLRNLKDLPLNAPIRYTWQYSNFNYLIVGSLIEKITGMSFEEALTEKVLKPLGMLQSHVFSDEYESTGNFSRTYDHEGEYTMHGLREVPYYNTAYTDEATGKKVGDASGAAGCIISNAEDMTKWLQFNLNKGKVGDTQLVREDLMDLIAFPHFTTGDNPDFPEETMCGYGLGWEIASFRGHKLMNHGGNLPGVTSIVAWVPELKLGVYCSVNMNVALLTEAVARSIVDAKLGIEGGDWSERYHKYTDQAYEHIKEVFRSFGGTPIEGTKPSHPLEEYAGTYSAPGYRSVTVSFEGEQMRAHFNAWDFSLEHFHYDSFATTEPFGEFPSGVIFSFSENSKGIVQNLSIMLGSEKNLKPICFVKQ